MLSCHTDFGGEKFCSLTLWLIKCFIGLIMEFKLVEGWGRVDFQIDSNSGCGIFFYSKKSAVS